MASRWALLFVLTATLTATSMAQDTSAQVVDAESKDLTPTEVKNSSKTEAVRKQKAKGELAPELTNTTVSNVLDQSPIKTDEKFTVELFSFEDFVYTGSRKTELGDQLELVSRFRYQITDRAWTSLGFRTDPDNDRFDNKTSDFELRSGYVYKNLVAQADFTFNTNDTDGGISFGFDLDSENTFLRYKLGDSNYQLTFFPFNFDGEVGVVFNSGDVTRVYYVEGTPNSLPLDAIGSATRSFQIAQKTIPGFELRYNDYVNSSHIDSAYIGLGATTYEFPNDPNFLITNTTAGNDWARKEVIGYKFGYLRRRKWSFNSFQYVGQTNDDETGVLLKSAASFYSLTKFSNFITEFEASASEGGRTPWRIDRQGNFGDLDLFTPSGSSVAAFHRIYADNVGNLQDWTGNWGYAGSVRVGLADEDFRPYVSYRYLSEDFVYRSRISAHNLRTQDLSESHGGLHGIGFGAFIYKGNFIINPRFEYLQSENDVFTKSDQISDQPVNQVRTDNDFSLFINISYFFDKRTGPRTFRLN